MSGTLMLCSRCFRLWGCGKQGLVRCAECVTHDCPVLPAPSRAEGLCERCAADGVFLPPVREPRDGRVQIATGVGPLHAG